MSETHSHSPATLTPIAFPTISSKKKSVSSSSTTTTTKEPRYPIYRPPPMTPAQSSSKKTQTPKLKSKAKSGSSTEILPQKRGKFLSVADEQTPLLGDGSGGGDHSKPAETVSKNKKPFYRARPLWLVPFAVIASLVRGMTLAPRVEVYTQVACHALHGRPEYNHTLTLPALKVDQHSATSLPSPPPLYASFDSHLSPSLNTTIVILSPNPTSALQSLCLSDPAVQASVARLQTTMTITIGLLSALTTGWWGRFGERYGRTKVLAVGCFTMFWTDLIFILTSTPNLPFPLSIFSYHPSAPSSSLSSIASTVSTSSLAFHPLLLSALLEGLLGGWSTLQSTTIAYISDCTSPGSRAHVFSRFTGVLYLGFGVGPAIGGWIIRHWKWSWVGMGNDNDNYTNASNDMKTEIPTVTVVFWIAILCSFVNFFLALFVFPESLSQERRKEARRLYRDEVATITMSGSGGDVDKSELAGRKEKQRAQKPEMASVVEDVEGVGGALMGIGADASSSSSSSSSASSPRQGQEDVHDAQILDGTRRRRDGIFTRLLSPLRIFLPVYVDMPTRNGLGVKRRKDWSLTLLAGGLMGWMLSTGVYQIKYLYAGHVYGWGAEQLSYYISFMGGARALFLLFLLPYIIAAFKPKPPALSSNLDLPINKGKKRGKGQREGEVHLPNDIDNDELHDHEGDIDFESFASETNFESYASPSLVQLKTAAASNHVDINLNTSNDSDNDSNNSDHKSKKPPPTRLQLGREIRFDLRLTKCSLIIDILSHLLVALAPAPSFSAHTVPGMLSHNRLSSSSSLVTAPTGHSSLSLTHAQSQSLFVMASSLNSLGSGMVPAVHSLALCVMQARGLVAEFNLAGGVVRSSPSSSFPVNAGSNTPPSTDTGSLFAAFAVLQAVGQMILGPLLFGMVYSGTVASYPKAIFILAGAILVLSLCMVLGVKNPVGEVRLERRMMRFRKRMEKGSTTVSYGVDGNYGSTWGLIGGVSGNGSVYLDAQKGRANRTSRSWEEEIERRGRARRSKDLNGGAFVVLNRE